MSNPKPLPPLGPNERPNLTPVQIEWLLAQPVPMKIERRCTSSIATHLDREDEPREAEVDGR